MTTSEQLQEEEIHTFLWGPKGKEEASDFIPSPFSIKAAGILTLARWLLGGHKPTIFCLLAFCVKPLFSAPPARLSIISLSCSKQSERGLVTAGHGTSPPPSPQAGTAGPGLVPTRGQHLGSQPAEMPTAPPFQQQRTRLPVARWPDAGHCPTLNPNCSSFRLPSVPPPAGRMQDTLPCPTLNPNRSSSRLPSVPPPAGQMQDTVQR